jgi:hypothetical protein
MVDHVLNVSCDHIAVRCVPSATHVPGIDQSQSKIFHIRIFVTLFFNSFVVGSLLIANFVYLEITTTTTTTTAIEFSLGGSSPYTSTDKTNNIHIQKHSTYNKKHSKYKYTYYLNTQI